MDGGRTEAKLKNQMVLQPSLTRESNTNFKGCFNRDWWRQYDTQQPEKAHQLNQFGTNASMYWYCIDSIPQKKFKNQNLDLWTFWMPCQRLYAFTNWAIESFFPLSLVSLIDAQRIKTSGMIIWSLDWMTNDNNPLVVNKFIIAGGTMIYWTIYQ